MQGRGNMPTRTPRTWHEHGWQCTKRLRNGRRLARTRLVGGACTLQATPPGRRLVGPGPVHRPKKARRGTPLTPSVAADNRTRVDMAAGHEAMVSSTMGVEDLKLQPRHKRSYVSVYVGILALLLAVGITVPLVLQFGVSSPPPPPPSQPPAAPPGLPHFGFPICYTSFVDYLTEWTNDPPVPQDTWDSWNQGSELRPPTGHQLMPYETFTSSECSATELPLVALGPHLVGLGLTYYAPSSALHAFPDSFVGKLLVTAVRATARRPQSARLTPHTLTPMPHASRDTIESRLRRAAWQLESPALDRPPHRHVRHRRLA